MPQRAQLPADLPLCLIRQHAGGIESVAVVLAVQNGVMPPTINLDNPDDGFDINLVPNTAQQKPLRYALNNSFGFGGHNVSLCFGRFDK